MEENKQEKPENKKKIILIGVISLIVGIAFLVWGITSCVGLFSNEDKKELKISNIAMSVEYNEYWGYSAKITGKAVNVCGENLSYASVEFSIYDVEGNNLGTALANINNLLKGDTWNFEATLLDFSTSKPVSYRLADIIAW